MRPQKEFVEDAIEALGITKTDLGVKLKKPNAYATVHGWTTGKFKLGYEDTIAILDLLEGRPSEEVSGARADVVQEALDNQRQMKTDLEQLSTVVAQIGREVSAVLALIEGQRAPSKAQRARRR